MIFGVLGLGSIGSRHAKNLMKMGHDVIAYDPATAPLPGREQVLERAEAIIIATPIQQHAKDLMDAYVEHGKPCLVEKPIAGSLPLDFFGKNIIMVGNNLRFHPCVIQTKLWLDAGAIGDVIWANFTCAQYNHKYKDPVTLNWGAHELDLALHFLGSAKVLSALSGYSNNNIEIISDLILQHGDARSVVHLDYVTAPEWRGYTIVGTHGKISCNLPGRNITLYQEDAEPNTTKYIGSYDWDYENEIAMFVHACVGNKLTRGATGEDGVNCLRVLLDAMERSGTGGIGHG